MQEDRAKELLARWRQGDQAAATELFEQYADRLVALARSRLSAKLAARIDPEDVVQSAYRSFFGDARTGRYEVQRGGDLWQLLVAITLHKLQSQVRRNIRQRRSVEREQDLADADGPGDLDAVVFTREPSPVEGVMLADELEQLMRELPPLHRRMLELRLQGFSLEEIAGQTGRTQRTVIRVLNLIRERLQERHSQMTG